MNGRIYYARCSLCGWSADDCTDIFDAKAAAEDHEREQHNGKLVAVFGWRVVEVKS